VVKRIVNVMDIGSSRIACVQGATAAEEDACTIQHTISMQTEGLGKGRLVHKQKFENGILRSVRAIEQMSKKKFQDIFINFSSHKVQSRFLTVHQPQKKVISFKSIIRLSQEVLKKTPPEQQLLHVIPMSYTVDQYDGVRDPRGMRCEMLSGCFHTITVPKSEIDPVTQALYDCHINVDAVISTPFASGISASVPDERNVGVTVIDIGAEFTHIAAFYAGQCIHVGSIPIAGQHITHDISYILGCTMDEAERLKRLYGHAFAHPKHANASVSVHSHSYGHTDHVEVHYIISIVRARLEEILQAIKQYFPRYHLTQKCLHRIVLTGGCAQIPYIKDLATQILDMPVRIGAPTIQATSLTHNELRNLTTTTGLLHIKGQEEIQAHLFVEQNTSLLSKLQKYFRKK